MLRDEDVYYILAEALEMLPLATAEKLIEGGSWQVGVDWDKVLAAYFRCLSATAIPEEYADKALGIVEEFLHYARDRHLPVAKRIGTSSQRQALRVRLRVEAKGDKRASL